MREHFGKIHDAEFVRACQRRHEMHAVRQPGESPRIGGTIAGLVQQHRVVNLHSGEVNYCHGVSVHPTAINMSRGLVELRENMADNRIFAVRRNTNILERAAAAGQPKFLGHLAGSYVNHAHHRRDVFHVGPTRVKMIGHQEIFPVFRDVRRDRFPLDGNPAHLPFGRQINHAHVVVEPVANVKRFAVQAQHRRLGRVSNRNGFDNFPLCEINDADLAFRGGAGDKEPRVIRGKNQTRRRPWHWN